MGFQIGSWTPWFSTKLKHDKVTWAEHMAKHGSKDKGARANATQGMSNAGQGQVFFPPPPTSFSSLFPFGQLLCNLPSMLLANTN